MENADAGHQPLPEHNQAVYLAANPSAAQHHADASAAATVFLDPRIQAEAAKATRRSYSRWPFWGGLVAVALALSLAALVAKALSSVGKPPLVKAPKSFRIEPQVVPGPWEFEWDSEDSEDLEELEALQQEEEEELKAGRFLADVSVAQGMGCAVLFCAITRTKKPLSGTDAREVQLEQHFYKDGMHYELLARFLKLTPEYNPEETAAELAEGLPIFLRECKSLEEEARDTNGAAVAGEDFGDEANGRINVFLTSNFLFAQSLFDFTSRALLRKCQISPFELEGDASSRVSQPMGCGSKRYTGGCICPFLMWCGVCFAVEPYTGDSDE
ncbi:hypothetical protein ACSSS7_002432 [Eimeria intestinalis]